MIKRINSLIVVSAFAVSVIFAATLAYAEIKIGYVDLARVFDNYNKTKDQDKVLNQQGEQKKEERQRLVNQIRKMKEEVDILSQDAKDKKQAEIDEKIKQLQDYDQQAKTSLGQERDKMVRDILKEIEATIQKQAKDKGYTIIFNNRVLLYAQEQDDLTEEILKTLNSQYKPR